MSSLKYFYIGLFILVAVISIALAFFGRSYVEDRLIGSLVAGNNTTTVESLTENIWKKYERASAKCLNEHEDAKLCDFRPELDKDMRSFFSNLKYMHYELYFENGIALSGKLQTDSEGIEMFHQALEGKNTEKMIFGYSINGERYNVVRAFIPIIPDKSDPNRAKRVPAVIELVYDITDIWSHPAVIQILLVSFVLFSFSSALGLMAYTMIKTEKLITKQYETNIDLVSAKASAEKENREKSQFLANISHELRTPLNAIIGFSEIIKDEVMGPINNQQYKEYINDINISGIHLLSLINDILDFSKAEAGKLKIEFVDVDVTKVMSNSLKLVTPTANESGVRLIDEIPKDHFILKTDGKRLKQVILNLLSNAVKFTPAGGSVTLIAWQEVAENRLVIEVKDTGVGIDAKDISKAMATFGQVENKLSRKHEGTGLGLPLSKKLVELMGGRLDLNSKIGVGTTVTISLPINRDLEQA